MDWTSFGFGFLIGAVSVVAIIIGFLIKNPLRF